MVDDKDWFAAHGPKGGPGHKEKTDELILTAAPCCGGTSELWHQLIHAWAHQAMGVLGGWGQLE